MADDLQALLNKINEEGLKKAEQTKADIIAKLNQSGSTSSSYKQDTSVPTMLQNLTASRPKLDFGLDTENLSEADCRDILVELFY